MSTSTFRPGGRTSETSKRIFAATMELLTEGGFTAVSFQEVGRRAKVGRATLYRRWTDPAALVGDAIRASAAEAITIADTGSLRGDLVLVLTQIGAFITSPIGRAALVVALSTGPAGEQGRGDQRWRHRWSEVEPIFQRAHRRGEISDMECADALFAALAGALYFRLLVMQNNIDEAWIDRVVAALLP